MAMCIPSFSASFSLPTHPFAQILPRTLLAVDLWVDVLVEARVRPDALKPLPVVIWVDVLFEARVRRHCGLMLGNYKIVFFFRIPA